MIYEQSLFSLYTHHLALRDKITELAQEAHEVAVRMAGRCPYSVGDFLAKEGDDCPMRVDRIVAHPVGFDGVYVWTLYGPPLNHNGAPMLGCRVQRMVPFPPL